MKNIKKIISLLLIGVLLTACFTFTALAEETEYTNIYELQVLHDLGVFEKEINTYNMEDSISRAEFAYMMARFMGHTSKTKLNQMDVADVEAEYTYASAIKYVIDHKVMSVDSNNKFYPLNKVTCDEAMRAFVAMLGYKPRVDTYGGNTAAYQRVSRELKLLSGVSGTGSAELKYADLVQMFYNSLEVSMLMVTSMTEKDGELIYSYSNQTGDTPLLTWHKAGVIYGLLTNIERGSTTVTGNNLAADAVKVGGYTFYLGEVEAEQYMGYQVKAYYDKETNTLLSVVPDVNENDVHIIAAEDIIKVQDGTLYYEKNGKTAKISIPTSSDVVYNGVAVTYDKRNEALTPHDGYLVVNNFKAGDVKTLVLVTEYKTYVVGAKTIDYEIYDAIAANSTLTLNPSGSSIKITDEDGEALTYEELAEGDVLTVAASLGGERIRVQRSNKKVTGTLSQYMLTGDSKYFMIDGVKYLLSREYENTTETYPQLGTQITISLNSSGKIAAVANSDGTLYKYGFIKDVAVKDDVWNKNLMLRIFDGSTVQTYDCDEKLCVDNYETKDGDEAINALAKSGSTDSNRVFQPIRFRVNSDNIITDIDTAYRNTEAGESADSLRYIYRGNNPYNLGAGSSLKLEASAGYNFGQKFITNSTDKRWTIPTKSDADDEYFRGSITLWPDGYFVVDGLTSREDSLTAELVLSYKSANSSVIETMYGVVKDVWEVENSDGVLSHQIYYANSEGSDSSMCTVDNTVIYNAESSEGKGAYTVSKGDIISFGRSGKDQIVEIEVLYDSETMRWLSGTDSVGSFGNHIVLHGYVLQKEGTILRLGSVMPTSTEEMLSAASRYINVSPSVIYRWEADKKEVTKITKDELISYAQSPDACSEVVTCGYNGAERVVVIYK